MITRVSRGAVRPIVAALVIWVALGLASDSAHAATLYWTGGGSSAYLSHNDNWSPQRTPESGDYLVFGLGSDNQPNEPQRTTITNDLGGRTFTWNFENYSFSLYPLGENHLTFKANPDYISICGLDLRAAWTFIAPWIFLREEACLQPAAT